MLALVMMIGTPGHENHVDHIISYHDDHDKSADNCNWDTIGGHFRTHMTIMMATLVPVTTIIANKTTMMATMTRSWPWWPWQARWRPWHDDDHGDHGLVQSKATQGCARVPAQRRQRLRCETDGKINHMGESLQHRHHHDYHLPHWHH